MNIGANQKRCAFHAREIRIERRRIANEELREKRAKITGVGLEMFCLNCGKTVIRGGWKQKYCKECGVFVNNHKDHQKDYPKYKALPKPGSYAGTVINLSYPRNTAKSEKEALRMDALVRAARLPDYDPKHPERFIVEVVT
jgi:ribosomal protein S27AE